jgi:hypothetical protein
MDERTWSQRKAPINLEHVERPQAGDFWHEMFSPYVVVLAVDGDNLTVCRAQSYPDKDHWTWDLTKLSTITQAELRKLVTYGTIPGFVADCEPQHHMWAVEEYQRAHSAGKQS